MAMSSCNAAAVFLPFRRQYQGVGLSPLLNSRQIVRSPELVLVLWFAKPLLLA